MKIFGNKSKEIKELQPEKKSEEKYAPPGAPPAPPVKLPEIKKLPPPAPPPPSQSRPPSSKSPPLFIKVDKYRNIIKNIRDLKSHILNLRDAIDVLGDMQKEMINGIEIAHKALDEVNMIIANLDSFFLRPHGIEHHMEEEVPEPGRISSGEVHGYVRDVSTQLEKLRAQLRAIE